MPYFQSSFGDDLMNQSVVFRLYLYRLRNWMKPLTLKALYKKLIYPWMSLVNFQRWRSQISWNSSNTVGAWVIHQSICMQMELLPTLDGVSNKTKTTPAYTATVCKPYLLIRWCVYNIFLGKVFLWGQSCYTNRYNGTLPRDILWELHM